MTDMPARPFYELIGIEPVSAVEGRSVVVLPESPQLGNSRGDTHGGAVFTLLDAACANAARSSLPPGAGAATIGLTITYMAPGRGQLTGHGIVLRTGRTVLAVEAEARDEAGTLVAKAFGTMRAIVPKEKSR